MRCTNDASSPELRTYASKARCARMASGAMAV